MADIHRHGCAGLASCRRREDPDLVDDAGDFVRRNAVARNRQSGHRNEHRHVDVMQRELCAGFRGQRGREGNGVAGRVRQIDRA